MRRKNEEGIPATNYDVKKYTHVTQETLKDTKKVNGILGMARNLLSRCPAGLADVVENIQVAMALTGDYINGRYRDVSPATVAALLGALAYLVLPLDAVADIIPVIGFIDDATVLALAFKQCDAELSKYTLWKSA